MEREKETEIEREKRKNRMTKPVSPWTWYVKVCDFVKRLITVTVITAIFVCKRTLSQPAFFCAPKSKVGGGGHLVPLAKTLLPNSK